MATPDKATLSDSRKLAIQADMTRHFPSGVIGVDDSERRDVFRALNDRLLDKHVELHLAEGVQYPGSVEILAVDVLLHEAQCFYAARKDHLSVTDYVTDFPDIVARSKVFAEVSYK